MNRDALAFFRILPAGAADVGRDVSRDELRAAGLGEWSMTEVGRDDLGEAFGGEYDEVLPLEEEPTDPRVTPVVIRFGKVG